ncbi:MAG: hypothetical protein AABZ28_03305 [Nitrospinota bacterium]
MHNSTPPDLPLQRGGIFTFAVYKYVRLFIAVAIVGLSYNYSF